MNGTRVVVSVTNMLKYDQLAYFNIQVTGNTFKIYNTDRSISKLFSIDQKSYKERLVKNVIRHDKIDYTDEYDTYFYHREIPEYVYEDRFKEEFAEELILVALGGDKRD